MDASRARDDLDRLKALKSAFLLEARGLEAQGQSALARPLFRRAAELECRLADAFHTKGEANNAAVSQLSAASCYAKAGQYQKACDTARGLTDELPEVQQLIAQWGGQRDLPGALQTPAIEALVRLLVKNNVISESEWLEALAAG